MFIINKLKEKSDDEDFENLDTSTESSNDEDDEDNENTNNNNDSENDDDDDDNEDNDDNHRIKNKNQKKYEQKLKKSNQTLKIIFNVSDTQYDVVKYVGKKIFKWKLSFEQDGEWDIFWTDSAVQPETLARMQPYQKINHFPGMYSIARKNHLGRNLMRMRKIFQDNYNFFPPTWLLPSEFNDFKAQFKSNKSKTYIIKPEASCQGRGIFLTKTWETIRSTDHYVAQRYLSKPYLIENLKFDLRLYVLLAGCDPLKIFLFNEGLARFATEKYQEPNDENIEEVCMHLTNYAINKDNPNFVFNEDAAADDVGHKRSITSVFKLLEMQGHDIQKLWNDIKKMIIKTFCSIQPILAHNYKSCQPDEPYNNMCFEILGFDIMLDHKLKPWLIEVNHTPSFTTDTPLDRNIKKNVIKDTLNLMNISLKTKILWKNKKRMELQQRVLTGKKLVKSVEERQAQFEQAQKERNEWENMNLNGFTKIFPFDNPVDAAEPYDEFIKESNKWWQEWTGLSIKRNTKKIFDDKLPRFTFSMEKSALNCSPPVIIKKDKGKFSRSNPQSITSKPTNCLGSNQNSGTVTPDLLNSIQNDAILINTNEEPLLPLITEAQMESMIEGEDHSYLIGSKKHLEDKNSLIGLERTDLVPEDSNNNKVNIQINNNPINLKQSKESINRTKTTVNTDTIVSPPIITNATSTTNNAIITTGIKDNKRIDTYQPPVIQYIGIRARNSLRQSSKDQPNIQKNTFTRDMFEKYMQRDASARSICRSNTIQDRQTNTGNSFLMLNEAINGLTKGDYKNEINNQDEKTKILKINSLEIPHSLISNRIVQQQPQDRQVINTMYQLPTNTLHAYEKSNQLPKVLPSKNIVNMMMIGDNSETISARSNRNIFIEKQSPLTTNISSIPTYTGVSTALHIPRLEGRIKTSFQGNNSNCISNLNHDNMNANNNNNNQTPLIIRSKFPISIKYGKGYNSGNYLQPRLMQFFIGHNNHTSALKGDEDLIKTSLMLNANSNNNNNSNNKGQEKNSRNPIYGKVFQLGHNNLYNAQNLTPDINNQIKKAYGMQKFNQNKHKIMQIFPFLI